MYKPDFPLLTKNSKLIYLDSAATTQKPQVVIDAVSHTYEHLVANPHRGLYELARKATEKFESVRTKVARFINAANPQEIVFTSGATESINLVEQSWALSSLSPGDIIITSDMEHHSNYLPWHRLQDEMGIKLVSLPYDADFRLDYKNLKVDMTKIKLVALAHASNVLGTVNPIAEIVDFFRAKSPQTRILVDAAQSAGHMPIDVQAMDIDFLAFSSHKMCGPSGVGVLYIRNKIFEEMEPYQRGGQMVQSVSKDNVMWADPPYKFEAGTQNIEGVIGFGAALDYLQSIGLETIYKHEQELCAYALSQLKNVEVYGPDTAQNRLAIFTFNVDPVHAHDVAEILNRQHIAIRSGHHCAEPLMQCLGIPAAARASFYIYNSKKDVDSLIEGISQVKKIMKV